MRPRAASDARGAQCIVLRLETGEGSECVLGKALPDSVDHLYRFIGSGMARRSDQPHWRTDRLHEFHFKIPGGNGEAANIVRELHD